MAKKYHPDVWDDSFNKENKLGSFNDYTETSDDNDNCFDEAEKDAWNTFEEYYPNAKKETIKLAKLQKKLLSITFNRNLGFKC